MQSILRQNKTHRIFIEDAINVGSQIKLNKNLYSRIHNVLRIRKNEKIIFFNGNGHDYMCSVSESDKSCINVEKKYANSANFNNTLAISISNNKCMDLVIQKSVELGIESIMPIVSIRSHHTDLEKRFKHWKKIIISACEQCGNSSIPILKKTIALPNLMNDKDFKNYNKICFDISGNEYKYDKFRKNRNLILIGPEGGFDEEEKEMMRKYDWSLVSLGDRILRTETACIVAQTLLRDW